MLEEEERQAALQQEVQQQREAEVPRGEADDAMDTDTEVEKKLQELWAAQTAAEEAQLKAAADKRANGELVQRLRDVKKARLEAKSRRLAEEQRLANTVKDGQILGMEAVRQATQASGRGQGGSDEEGKRQHSRPRSPIPAAVK